MNIAIIGTGNVGLITGTCLAQVGNHVICYDIDITKINSLNKGELFIYEPNLESLLDKNMDEGNIVFSNNQELRYVSRKEQTLILPNSSYKLDLDLIYKDCQLLIIHFFSPIKLYVLKNKPPHIKVIWSVWGSDAYNHFADQNFFEPLTSNVRRGLFHNRQ